MTLITGYLGAGKTTLLQEMCNTLSFKSNISYTTRRIRPGEVDGVDYHYISLKTFHEMDKQNLFIEKTNIFNHYYATPLSIADVKENTVVDIDLNGVRAFKKNHIDANYVLIMPPSKILLEQRLIARGQDAVSLPTRLASYDLYDANRDLFDTCIVNDSIASLFEQMSKYIDRINKTLI